MNISAVGGSYISRNLPKAGSRVKPPDWENIAHEGMDRPSESEFDKLIDDLAKELAEATKNKDYDKYNELVKQKDKLYAQYISKVSPDRKTLAEEAMKIPGFGAMNIDHWEENKNDKNLTLLDYLDRKDGVSYKLGREGVNRHERYSVQLKTDGGSVTTSGSGIDPPYYDIYIASENEPVMHYNSKTGAWVAQPTSKEWDLGQVFLKKINSLEKYYENTNSISKPNNVESNNKLDILV